MVWLDILPLDGTDHLFRRCGEPVSVGLPFPRGRLPEPVQASLVDLDGHKAPVQATVLDRWLDGTVRWGLFDFKVSAERRSNPTYALQLNDPAPSSEGPRVHTVTAEKEVVVDTGVAQFRLTTGCFPFSEVLMNRVPAIVPSRTSLSIEDADGRVWPVTVRRIAAVASGPVRTIVTLELEGHIPRTGNARSLQLECQLEFFSQSAAVRFSLTLRNARRAKHPGGIWVLGDPGSIYLRDLALTIGVPTSDRPSEVCCSPDLDHGLEPWPTPFELYQDSSGGELWRSSNHLNRSRTLPVTFQGYRLRSRDVTRLGRRATPIVSLRHAGGELTVAMRHFWQNFPRAVEATDDSLILRLFPRQHADLHEIQGGEQKTHVFTVAFGPDPVSETPLAWARQPALVRARPDWYASTGALPYLVPKPLDPNPAYRELINAAVEGSDTFEHKREAIDEYGWRHFGDIYGDHETVRSSNSTPLVSHYNNQYDPLAGFARQFMSSGDARWWRHMDELAAHVRDIDLYHTTEDKAAYNGGMFWHTLHYTDADTSTHRSYPRLPGVHGGGPSSEHNFTTGLMLHYFLTGDSRSREAAVSLAKFVINLDDGRKSRWRWIDRGATGFATASGSFLYHGPGRGGANSLNALIDGHHLTGDRDFLQKAEEIIRRCVNPGDNVEARNLLDAERRWFYTMFLQSLGKYLDYKAELEELDENYAYARSSLLHYARWMVQHEYPYLDKPEVLEFPTETWAAQDIRKSDVLNFAAYHSEGDERGRFADRARFFFDYSSKTLQQMPTRTLVRPVAVLLTSGTLQSYFQLHSNLKAPAPNANPLDHGPPLAFVPQPVRVKRRLMTIAAALMAIACAAAAYLIVR